MEAGRAQEPNPASWMAEWSRPEMVLFRISPGKSGTLERCCGRGVP